MKLITISTKRAMLLPSSKHLKRNQAFICMVAEEARPLIIRDQPKTMKKVDS